MAKVLKGKNPDDEMNEKIIKAGLKKYGKPLTPAEWAKEKNKKGERGRHDRTRYVFFP